MKTVVLLATLTLAPAGAYAAPPPTPPPAMHDAAARLTGAALSSNRAWTRLSELCDGIGNRLSGSQSLERAVTWAAGALREDGADSVWLQPVQVPRWVRGREHASIVAPRREPMAMRSRRCRPRRCAGPWLRWSARSGRSATARRTRAT